MNNSDDIFKRASNLIASMAPLDLTVSSFFKDDVVLDSATHNTAGFTLKLRLNGSDIVHPFKGIANMQRLKVIIAARDCGVVYEDEAFMLRWSETSTTGQDVRLRLHIHDDVLSLIDRKGEVISVEAWILSDDETLASKPRRKWSELSVGQQSAILCERQDFRDFIFSYAQTDADRDMLKALPVEDQKQLCVSMIRRFCGVASRSEINPNKAEGREPYRRWQRLYSSYQEASLKF